METINNLLRVRIAPSLIAVLLIGGCLGAAHGQTASTNAPPPKNPWETTAAAGVTLTRGNSETFLATVTLDSKRKWDKNEAFFGAAGGYGENKDPETDETVKNTEFVNGYAQYNRLFTDRFYGGLRVDANYDGIAGIDYRVRVSPLAGYYVVKTDKTSLSFEVGPSAVWEKREGQSADSYFGFRAGERFEHKLSANTKVWQLADYVPRVDDWTEQYVITFEAGIDTAITKRWSLRVVFQDIYDNSPSEGRERNDIRLVAGTAYKF